MSHNKLTRWADRSRFTAGTALLMVWWCLISCQPASTSSNPVRFPTLTPPVLSTPSPTETEFRDSVTAKEPISLGDIRLSPMGEMATLPSGQIAYVVSWGDEIDEFGEVYVIDVPRGSRTMVHPGGWTEQRVVQGLGWSDDGKNIYLSNTPFEGSFILDLSEAELRKVEQVQILQDSATDMMSFDLEQHSVFKPYKLGPEEQFEHHFGFGDGYYSPDGGQIVFSVGRDQYTCWDLWIINSQNIDPRKLAECATYAGWSPDSQWLAYTTWDEANTGHRLYIIPMAGGEPTMLTRGDTHIVAAWGPAAEE